MAAVTALVLIAIFLPIAPVFSEPSVLSGETFLIDDFSGPLGKEGLTEGWEPLEFSKIPRHSVYAVVDDEDDQQRNRVLKAISDNAASAIYKEVEIDLKEYPVLSWRWKVMGVLEGGDATSKDGDDYAARVYITFKYEPENTPFFERLKYAIVETLYNKTPASAVNYIWANRLEKGTHVPNPYTDKVMMVAVESGPGAVGIWISEQRNLYHDYMTVFGVEPPLVSGISVMTDSDNTAGSTEAYFDDIVFKKSEQ